MKSSITKYMFGMNIKLGMIPCETSLSKYFPTCEDMIMKSKFFDDYEEAVKACNGLVEEFTSSINNSMGVEAYKMKAEINPTISNAPSISKDWEHGELAKVWIVPDNEPSGLIVAVGLAQIMEVMDSGVSVQ